MLLKNPEKLTPENKQKLKDVFREFPELKTAYDIKYELRYIFESDISRQNAQTQIELWVEKAKKLDNRYTNTFLNTLKNWKQYVL
ncbi:MAG: hypothetical protein B6244_14465, partial [Candidatus Cloacimonetes bacterium 4572_55]